MNLFFSILSTRIIFRCTFNLFYSTSKEFAFLCSILSPLENDCTYRMFVYSAIKTTTIFLCNTNNAEKITRKNGNARNGEATTATNKENSFCRIENVHKKQNISSVYVSFLLLLRFKSDELLYLYFYIFKPYTYSFCIGLNIFVSCIVIAIVCFLL